MARRSGVVAAIGIAMAISGSYFLVLWFMKAGDVTGWWVPSAAHGTSGLVGAGVAGSLGARPRPWEDAAGAALFMALMIGLFLLMDEPLFSWQPARSDHPVTVTILLSSLTIAGALLGGRLGARAGGGREGAARTWLFSAFASLGLVWLVTFAMLAAGGSEDDSWVVFPALVVGGFVAQLAAPRRRPWVCGAGGLSLVLLTVQAALDQGLPVPWASLVLGSGFLWLLAAVGAGVSLLVSDKPFPEAAAELPTAQVQR